MVRPKFKRRPRDGFERKLALGRKWEMRMATWASSRGWYVLPTYDFSGASEDKAPKLLSPADAEDLVVPDLQCICNGSMKWLEVKYKSNADLYRRGNYLVTGISQRLLRHYSEVEAQSPGPVVVAFVHGKECEVRGTNVRTLLDTVAYRSDFPPMGPMAFWEYEKLPLWEGVFSELNQIKVSE